MMIEAINRARAERGLPALRVNAQLGNAATAHALDMSRNPGMVHTGSDGSDGGTRIRRAGYDWAQWGEVVGWGFNGDANRMTAWWLASPAHVGYVLATNVEEIGVGYVFAPGSLWGHYWVVNFGRRQGQPATPAPEPEPTPPADVSYMPIVTSSPGLDLLRFMQGDGRAYRVGNAWGSYEVFQTQTEGERFYQVKAWDDLSVVNWEEFVVSADTIGRDVDTSPGGGRYYRQFGAPWVRRRMRVGERFSQAKRLQFFRQENCEALEAFSGNVTDTIEVVALHERHTFPARDWPAVTLEKVVQLRWVEGGEDYYFAAGYGLVGWGRTHQDPNSPAWSAICEMRPGVGRLERLRIGCL